MLPFVIGSTPLTDSDPYLSPRPDSVEEPRLDYIQVTGISEELPRPNKTKLFYHVNRLTNVHHLCILPSVAPDILAIIYGKSHLGFSYCYKIIIRSWFIRCLTKLFCLFICHCPQCLALQTRQYPPYGSLQLIKSPPVPFFTLILDFVLVLPLSKEGFNAIMSVTCKFSKRVTQVEDVDTWLVE